jgi:hypothetical protein
MCVLAAAPAILVLPSPAAAKSPWTEPVVLYSTTGVTLNPLLIADPSGDVHFFVTSKATADPITGPPTDDPGSLVYMRFHNARWSPPTDVLVTPGGGPAVQPAIVLDDRGYLQVVWKGGPTGQLYYSRAHVSEASTPARWEPAKKLSDDQLAPGAFGVPMALASSPDGKLHLVYATMTGALEYTASTDGGDSWSRPATLIDSSTANAHVDLPRLATDAHGDLFMTWSELQTPRGWPPTGAFYARSTDSGESWSKPVRVAGPNYGELNVAATDSGVVHFLWNSVGQLGQRGYAQSNDGGQTFTQAPGIIPLGLKSGGFTGFPSVAVDSANTLHLVTSLQASNPANSGIYHVQWDGDHWTQPIYLSTNVVGNLTVEEAAIAISSGGLMHVVYEDDTQRIWYTSARANAPMSPPAYVPPPVALAAPTPMPTATPQVLPTPPVASAATASDSVDQSRVLETGAVSPLVPAAVACALMLGVLLAFRGIRGRG